MQDRRCKQKGKHRTSFGSSVSRDLPSSALGKHSASVDKSFDALSSTIARARKARSKTEAPVAAAAVRRAPARKRRTPAGTGSAKAGTKRVVRRSQQATHSLSPAMPTSPASAPRASARKRSLATGARSAQARSPIEAQLASTRQELARLAACQRDIEQTLRALEVSARSPATAATPPVPPVAVPSSPTRLRVDTHLGEAADEEASGRGARPVLGETQQQVLSAPLSPSPRPKTSRRVPNPSPQQMSDYVSPNSKRRGLCSAPTARPTKHDAAGAARRAEKQKPSQNHAGTDPKPAARKARAARGQSHRSGGPARSSRAAASRGSSAARRKASGPQIVERAIFVSAPPTEDGGTSNAETWPPRSLPADATAGGGDELAEFELERVLQATSALLRGRPAVAPFFLSMCGQIGGGMGVGGAGAAGMTVARGRRGQDGGVGEPDVHIDPLHVEDPAVAGELLNFIDRLRQQTSSAAPHVHGCARDDDSDGGGENDMRQWWGLLQACADQRMPSCGSLDGTEIESACGGVGAAAGRAAKREAHSPSPRSRSRAPHGVHRSAQCGSVHNERFDFQMEAISTQKSEVASVDAQRPNVANVHTAAYDYDEAASTHRSDVASDDGRLEARNAAYDYDEAASTHRSDVASDDGRLEVRNAAYDYDEAASTHRSDMASDDGRLEVRNAAYDYDETASTHMSEVASETGQPNDVSTSKLVVLCPKGDQERHVAMLAARVDAVDAVDGVGNSDATAEEFAFKASLRGLGSECAGAYMQRPPSIERTWSWSYSGSESDGAAESVPNPLTALPRGTTRTHSRDQHVHASFARGLQLDEILDKLTILLQVPLRPALNVVVLIL